MIIKFLKSRIKKYTSLFFWRRKRTELMLAVSYFFIPIFYPEMKVVNYLHVDKTGGTAIKDVFVKKMIFGNFLMKMHIHKAKLRDIKKGEKVIFAVRDPISRFVSGFNCGLRRGFPRHRLKWSKEEEISFEIFKTPQELAISIFSDNNDIRNKAIMAMKSCHHIKTFYWDWFENEEYLNSRKDDILFVFRQERLSEDFDFFVRKFLPGSKVRLPEDDVLKHKTPDGYSTNLSEEAVNNLKKWYKRDYEFLEFIQKLGLLKD